MSIGYFAWRTARTTTSAWFSPTISQVLYQTSLIGGVLVLIGLFLIASISPHLIREQSLGGLVARVQSRRSSDSIRLPALPFGNRPAPATNVDDREWSEIEAILAGAREQEAADVARTKRAEDTTRVGSSSLMSPSGGTTTGNPLAERLSEIRSRRAAVLVAEGTGNNAVLLRITSELRPLLVAARKAGLNASEVKRLVAETVADDEIDFAQRVRLVDQVKRTLEAAIVERISEDLHGVLVHIEKTKAITQHVHSAELAAAEAVALLDTGNYVSAMDRTTLAVEAFDRQAGAVAARMEGMARASSFVALTGPSFVAIAYVAVSAMMLPGTIGFLQDHYQLNTGVILVLSYGWLGLLCYALLSVYLVLRPPAIPATRAPRTRPQHVPDPSPAQVPAAAPRRWQDR